MDPLSPMPTDAKESVDKLHYESNQLHALLDLIPDTIFFKDLQSHFVLASRSKVEQILKRVPDIRERRAKAGLQVDIPEPELLTGLTDFDFFENDDAKLAYDDEQQVARTGVAMIGKLETLAFVDETRGWWMTSKMPWRNDSGVIIGTIGISKDVTALKEAEYKLELMNRQLLETSRQAGMAEVAAGVLHNVGNVLNSVNVSAVLVADQVRHSKFGNVARVCELLRAHEADLAAFLSDDPKGKMVTKMTATVPAQVRVLEAQVQQTPKTSEHMAMR